VSDKQELKFNWRRLEEQGLLESEKNKPSSDPAWWAKRSCNKCLGRGVMGTVTTKMGTNTMKNGQICPCASKRFTKWRNDYVADFVKRHRDPAILESADSVDKQQ
jgi:hypothetical protein